MPLGINQTAIYFQNNASIVTACSSSSIYVLFSLHILKTGFQISFFFFLAWKRFFLTAQCCPVSFFCCWYWAFLTSVVIRNYTHVRVLYMQEELTEELKAQLMPEVGIQISVRLKKHHRLKAEIKQRIGKYLHLMMLNPWQKKPPQHLGTLMRTKHAFQGYEIFNKIF